MIIRMDRNVYRSLVVAGITRAHGMMGTALLLRDLFVRKMQVISNEMQVKCNGMKLKCNAGKCKNAGKM